MKTKTAAGLAVILLPLLLLGGGVWVASARRSPAPWAAPPAGTTGSPKVAAFLSESRAPASAAAEPADALIQAKVPIHRAQIRAEIVTTLERRRYVGRRSAECKELWPEASTEEEGRALQREKVALDKEWGPLGGKLKELAASDPANIVEMVRSAHDLPERLQLMGLIAPDVNSEIATEESLSGPLLAGLLSLAHGETEEKMYFAAFAGKLTRANRELGQALLTLMADSDFHVSKHAGQALWALADQGALKEFFKGQIPALKQAALRQGEELDYQYVGTPLKILASIGADEADVFVLHRFETIESRNDYETITAVLISASRIAGRHEARLVLAILRALELPGQPYMHENLLRVAEHLPPEKLANIARVVDGKGWPSNPNYLPRVMVAGNRRDRQVYRSMIGVSRWQLKMAPDSPGIHRHR